MEKKFAEIVGYDFKGHSEEIKEFEAKLGLADTTHLFIDPLTNTPFYADEKMIKKAMEKLNDKPTVKFTRESNPTTYIHYGHGAFDTRLFRPAGNGGNLPIKPRGGLWGSSIESSESWKDWCGCSNFRDCDDAVSFKFAVRDPSKVFFVDSEESFKELAGRYGKTNKARFGFGDEAVFIDFEKMIRDGWDALEISITDYGSLYYLLYGWDCDSIVVFNRDAVVPV